MPVTRIAAPQHPKDKLRAAIAAAIASNTTFLAVASPTPAQSAAQVQALTRQVSNLIRLVAGVLDGTAS